MKNENISTTAKEIRAELLAYQPFLIYLREDCGFDKQTIDKVFQKLKEEYIEGLHIKNVRSEYNKIKQSVRKHIIEPLIAELKAIKKERESLGSIERESQYQEQWQYLKGMSFIEAIILLPQFQYLIVSLRKRWGIDTKKLRSELSLSEEEIALATYDVHPGQYDALLRQLGRHKTVDAKHRLWQKKNSFEKKFFSGLPDAQNAAKDTGATRRNTTKIKFPWIPKQQVPNVINFLLYGVDTGKLLSLTGGSSGERREWQRRLLSTAPKRAYTPFLRYWLYYYLRNVKKQKSIQKTNQTLQDYGFPPFRRENDSTIRKRYEDYFLR